MMPIADCGLRIVGLLAVSCLSFTLSGSTSAWACPTCKEALLDPGQAQRVLQAATAYAVSIGLLLIVPALLITAVAAAVVRAHRRQVLQSGIDTPGLSR